MATLIAGVVAVLLLYSLLQMFRAANPVVLARAIKIGGGVVALAVAAFTGVKGEPAEASLLVIFPAQLRARAQPGEQRKGRPDAPPERARAAPPLPILADPKR